MDKVKKCIILVLILVLLILILNSTFSKYVNQANATKEAKIGQWNIKINDQDITRGKTDFVIDDFIWEGTPHVKEPKVAPGMKGNFKIKIDPTGTDVAVKYSIEIDETKLTEIADINLKITGLKENGVKKELVTDKNGKLVIEKIKTLEQIKSGNDTIDELEIEVTWVNDDTEETNKNDSKVGSLSGRKIQMPVTVNAIQYTE